MRAWPRIVSTLVVAALVAACAPETSPAVPPVSPAPSSAPDKAPVTPSGFATMAATSVTADGEVCELCLWLADTNDLRARGLMGVTDLGGADGMLFRYPGETTGAFWMKDTLMPLSIAFYDPSGEYLDSFDMDPCTQFLCDSFRTPADFQFAIEVEQGTLTDLGLEPGSVLEVSDLPCDPAA